MNHNPPVKIFLVDDDALFLKLMKAELQQVDDYTIETYLTGEQCIENLHHDPDVIILDYILNGMDKNAMNGIGALDKIKAYNPDIPVVILSCQDDLDTALNCLNHKAFDYVVKNEVAFIHLKILITSITNFQRMEKELFR